MNGSNPVMRIIDVAYQNVGELDRTKVSNSLKSPGMMRVPLNTPAIEVFSRIKTSKTPLILVVDELNELRGVVAPAWIEKQLQDRKGGAGQTTVDILIDMELDPKEQVRGFQHEWLNFERPVLYYCNGGKHYTDRCPCPAGHAGKCEAED
ncbi:MAG TPA: hypothetical protein VFR15_13470 [Chloroflexia bacterium]|nr:hypothetical protein [Chloroflexia bacterium]